jgi:leukotriene A-4 hydrolase/aminopeptidase
VRIHFGVVLCAALLTGACTTTKTPLPVQSKLEGKFNDRVDRHSYAKPSEVRVEHVGLDLDVSFTEKVLRGSATLSLERLQRDKPLIIDSRELKISRVKASEDGVSWSDTTFETGATDRVLGAPVTITLPPAAKQVRIFYETVPSASGLQWLTPQQTAGKKQPFLFTQSQAIHARSWIPTQDSPAVRVRYSAKIRVPSGLRAVMSARNDPTQKGTSEYTFEMPQPIPAYLIALAVGNLDYKAISSRTGVWAEPPMLAKAAAELQDLEKMLQAAESLYGRYRWEQYDVLILPPSFPFGGMENPRLTFATPTILAGDKSLVGLIAHELAHSWSGNLVTNATWRDFWLNEGFTTYFERRIQEEVYGSERAEMEALIEKQEVVKEMSDLPEADEILYVDLKGRDPDEGMTQVPYVKGMLLLRRLEEVFGRDRFDAFLRGYFNHFAFQSIVTADFVDYLQTHLLDENRDLAAKIDLEAWLTKPGLPAEAPEPKSDALQKAETAAKDWAEGRRDLAALPTKAWSTSEWLHFLRSLPPKLDVKRMGQLDSAFALTQSGNSEILAEWLLMSIESGYEAAYPKLDRFLVEVGRRKYIKPLYQELAKSAEGKAHAKKVYATARAGYHPIAAATVDDLLK